MVRPSTEMSSYRGRTGFKPCAAEVRCTAHGIAWEDLFENSVIINTNINTIKYFGGLLLHVLVYALVLPILCIRYTHWFCHCCALICGGPFLYAYTQYFKVCWPYLILNPLQALKLQVRRLTASRRCTC